MPDKSQNTKAQHQRLYTLNYTVVGWVFSFQPQGGDVGQQTIHLVAQKHNSIGVFSANKTIMQKNKNEVNKERAIDLRPVRNASGVNAGRSLLTLRFAPGADSPAVSEDLGQ